MPPFYTEYFLQVLYVVLKKIGGVFHYDLASNFPILTFYFSTFHQMEFQNTKSG
jgi:hypothetical protein